MVKLGEFFLEDRAARFEPTVDLRQPRAPGALLNRDFDLFFGGFSDLFAEFALMPATDNNRYCAIYQAHGTGNHFGCRNRAVPCVLTHFGTFRLLQVSHQAKEYTGTEEAGGDEVEPRHLFHADHHDDHQENSSE